MSGQRWSEEEQLFLRNNFLSMTNKKLADSLPGRKALGVGRMLASMKLYRPIKSFDVGDRFHLLVVKAVTTITADGCRKRAGVMQCDCGNTKTILANPILRGLTKSCGCLRHTPTCVTHGKSRHTLYRTLADMLSRCYNPHIAGYKNYGGRGIRVCDEWRDSFESFYEWAIQAHWQPGLTIDRIDVNADYSPINCRWSTKKVQAANRRDTRMVTAWGETKSLVAWMTDERCQARKDTIRTRIDNYGWTAEAAISTPSLKKLTRRTAVEKKIMFAAYKAVSRAVAAGLLVKPATCEYAGCNAATIHAHHHKGYNQNNWLDVVWLCHRHHVLLEHHPNVTAAESTT